MQTSTFQKQKRLLYILIIHGPVTISTFQGRPFLDLWETLRYTGSWRSVYKSAETLSVSERYEYITRKQ